MRANNKNNLSYSGAVAYSLMKVLNVSLEFGQSVYDGRKFEMPRDYWDTTSFSDIGKDFTTRMIRGFDYILWQSPNALVNGSFRWGFHAGFTAGLRGSVQGYDVMHIINSALTSVTGQKWSLRDPGYHYVGLTYYIGYDPERGIVDYTVPVYEKLEEGAGIAVGNITLRTGPAFHTKKVGAENIEGLGAYVPAPATFRAGNDTSEGTFTFSTNIIEIIAIRAALAKRITAKLAASIMALNRLLLINDVGTTTTHYGKNLFSPITYFFDLFNPSRIPGSEEDNIRLEKMIDHKIDMSLPLSP